jgi:hypothetical protein
MPFSIVLLLRKSLPFTEERLNAAGELAWNHPFNQNDGSMYCALEATPAITLIKSGKYLFHLMQEGGFYLGPVEEIASQLPRPEQEQAWLQHTAWAALDLMNHDISRKEAYSALARWAVQLADSNCCGIYLPQESQLWPNDGTAAQGLQILIKKGPSVDL